LVDYSDSEASYYIVMERFLSKDLFDYISDHPGGVSERVAKEMFIQIVETVQHCRKKGIVHGDIKDENIVVNMETKEVKLIDFGSASLWTDKVQTQYNGTREYAPPEWFSARKLQADGQTVWSLGILLYSLVCGDIPFQTELQTRHSFPAFPDNLGLSQTVISLIGRCLDKSSSSRISMSELARHPWLRDTWTVDTDRFFVTRPVFV